MKTPKLPLKFLIATILIVGTVTLGYSLWLWYLCAKPVTLPGARNLSIEIPAIEPRYRLDPKAYIFTPQAWKLKPLKKPEVEKKARKTQTEGPLPITVDTASRPMKFCLGERCYEVLGYTGDAVVLDRADTPEGEHTLMLLHPGKSVEHRIRFEGIRGSAVKFFDLNRSETFTLKFFEVNATDFQPTNESNQSNKKTENAL